MFYNRNNVKVLKNQIEMGVSVAHLRSPKHRKERVRHAIKTAQLSTLHSRKLHRILRNWLQEVLCNIASKSFSKLMVGYFMIPNDKTSSPPKGSALVAHLVHAVPLILAIRTNGG